MINQIAMYRISTGNLFGISSGWVDAFHNKALAIVKDARVDFEDNYCDCNPAFAGAGITVFDKNVADKIEKSWKKMLPLALASMSSKWRAEYEMDIAK